MKRKAWFWILCFSSLNSISANASDLICAVKDSGYLPYNTSTGQWIGIGSFYQAGTCRKAIDSLKTVGTSNMICSWSSRGWAIFDAETGEKISNNNAYYFEFSTCQTSLNFSYNGVVCVPRASGSGLYDSHYRNFIGDGYYYEINNCIWASYSANSQNVCAPLDGYTAIYNRRYNEPVTGELIASSKQCYELNK